MTIQEQALKLLSEIAQQLDNEIIERWRYSKTPELREQCAVDLRVVGDLQRLIEEKLNEQRRTNK